MTAVSVVQDPTAESAIFGSPSLAAVRRGIADLQAGRPVLVRDGDQRLVVLAIDDLGDAGLGLLRALLAPAEPELLLTAQRARVIGCDGETPVSVAIGAADDWQTLLSLATAANLKVVRPRMARGPVAEAALDLAKLARLVPALVAIPARPDLPPALVSDLELDAADIFAFRTQSADSLRRISEAPIPLRSGALVRFIAFRDAAGGTAIALVVGDPAVTSDPQARPVPVRIHSACATGDIFGSRRCDCGEQLRMALERLERLGGGCLLYLDQEGRGVGLANKLRAYGLQDAGLDTIDANTTLGFHDDERDYLVAGRMLIQLDFTRVLLLTNNPTKIDGLRAAGIDVVDRLPVLATVNPDNRRYLEAKAIRAGHLLSQVPF